MPKKTIDHLVAYLTNITYAAGKHKRKETHKDFKEIFSVAALISKIMENRPLSPLEVRKATVIRLRTAVSMSAKNG